MEKLTVALNISVVSLWGVRKSFQHCSIWWKRGACFCRWRILMK
jgi:hypothetical protein